MSSVSKNTRKSKNPLRIVADWLFKPAMPAYEDGPGKAGPKRKAKAAAKRAAVSKAPTRKAENSANQARKQAEKPALDAETLTLAARGAELGFVDKKGNVRANVGNRILGKTQKGNKQAALAEYVARYDDQLAQAKAIAAQAVADNFAVLPQCAELRDVLKSAPGLGDDKVTLAHLDDAEAHLERLGVERRIVKQAVISDVEALPQVDAGASPDWVAAEKELAGLRARWSAADSAGPLHDPSLERRFEAATKAFAARKMAYFTDEGSNASAKRAIIAQVKRGKTLHSVEDIERLTEKTKREWASIGPATAALDARLSVEFKAAQTDLMAHYADNLADREADEAAALDQLADLAKTVARAKTDRNLDRADASLAGVGRQLGNLAREVDTTELEAELDTARGELSEKLVARTAARQGDEARAATIRKRARELAAADKHGINWKEADQELGALVTEADGLKALGAVGQKQLLGDLREARRDMGLNRSAFFEQKDQDREANRARKQALINDLPFYPNGARAAELQEHINSSFETWRKVGSAGRDHDDPLWEAYRTAREELFGKVRELRALEKDDFTANLAYDFQRKKEELYRLEGEVGREEMLAESTTDKDKAKKLMDVVASKKKRLSTLERDLMQLQRRLAKISEEDKKKSAASAAPSPEPSELPAE